jgi:hypothetical protein
MSHWNYRVTREQVTNPDGTTEPFYALREVYYDDDGKPNAWGKEPATFAGDTPGEVIESLIRASGAFPSGGVLDLDTRETVHVTYHGKQVQP